MYPTLLQEEKVFTYDNFSIQGSYHHLFLISAALAYYTWHSLTVYVTIVTQNARYGGFKFLKYKICNSMIVYNLAQSSSLNGLLNPLPLSQLLSFLFENYKQTILLNTFALPPFTRPISTFLIVIRNYAILYCSCGLSYGHCRNGFGCSAVLERNGQ